MKSTKHRYLKRNARAGRNRLWWSQHGSEHFLYLGNSQLGRVTYVRFVPDPREPLRLRPRQRKQQWNRWIGSGWRWEFSESSPVHAGARSKMVYNRPILARKAMEEFLAHGWILHRLAE